MCNFWVLQILFIHFLLFRKEKIKLYSHQKLCFTIILLLSFETNFASSFFRQSEYTNQDSKNIDEAYINITKNINPKILPIMEEKINETIRNSIKKANEDGYKSCRNKYNIFLLDDYFIYFIILAAFGYLITSFLKSYSVVKTKSLINKKFISINIIIIIMGILGLVLSIILLLITSLIPCEKDQYYRYICSSIKSDYSINKENNTFYFDNFLRYIVDIRNDLFPKDNE